MEEISQKSAKIGFAYIQLQIAQESGTHASTMVPHASPGLGASLEHFVPPQGLRCTILPRPLVPRVFPAGYLARATNPCRLKHAMPTLPATAISSPGVLDLASLQNHVLPAE